mgnify:CR=1 FL=1
MRQRPGAGIALVLVMAACFATMDTTVKFVGALLPVLVVLWARYGVQAAAMAVWLAVSSRRGGAGFRSAHPRFQAARGALLLASSTFGFFASRAISAACCLSSRVSSAVFGMPDSDGSIHLLLLDRQGRVLWRRDGAYDSGAAAELKSKLKALR